MLGPSKGLSRTPSHPPASSRESNTSEPLAEPRSRALPVDHTFPQSPNSLRLNDLSTQSSGRALSLPTLTSTTDASPPRSPSQTPSRTQDGDSLGSPDELIPPPLVSRTVSRSSIRASLARRKWRKWQAAEQDGVREDSDPSVPEELDEDSDVPTPRSGSGPRRHVTHIFGKVTGGTPFPAEGMTRERIRMRVTGGLEQLEEETKESYVDIAYDILYEHQRGAFAVGIPLFSSNSLLNFDPAAWVNARSGLPSIVNITNAVPPPGWRWDWDRWYVDMGGGFVSSAGAVSGDTWPGDVDEEGWEYSGAFGQRARWRSKKRAEGKPGIRQTPSSKGPPNPASSPHQPMNATSRGATGATSRSAAVSANPGAVDATNLGVGVTVKKSKVRTKWHGTHPFWNSFVRRRRWVRKRVRIPDATHSAMGEGCLQFQPLAGNYFSVHPRKPSRALHDPALNLQPSHPISPPAPTGLFSMPVASPHVHVSQEKPVETIDDLMAALRAAPVDRERIAHVRNFLANGEEEYHRLADAMPAIMGRIVFQQSRRRILAHLRARIHEAEEAYRDQHRQADAPEHAGTAEHLLRAVDAADRECARLRYWSDVRELEQEAETGRSRPRTEVEVDKWFQGDPDATGPEDPFSDAVESVPDKGKEKVGDPLTRESTWSTAKEEQDDDSESTTTVDGRGGVTPTRAARA